MASVLIPFLTLVLIIIIIRTVTLPLIRNHPMFAMVDNKVAEFKKRTFTSEEEKVRVKEQFKDELTTWKATIELKKQEILWRSKAMPLFGGMLLKKNIELIDNMKKKIQEEIDSLN